MPDNWKEGWHLDKRVNLSIIITLALQLAGFTWFMGSISEKVNTNQQSIVEIRGQQETLKEQGSNQQAQLARIESEIVGLRRDIGRLINALEE